MFCGAGLEEACRSGMTIVSWVCSFLRIGTNYSLVFPSALALAHLALAAAESLALTAGLLRQSFFLATFAVAVVPLTLAQRAFAAAEIAALPAALNRLLPFLAGLKSVAPVPLILAHLARCAAAILARTAADLRPFFGASSADGFGIPPPPAMESICACSASICSLMARMRWSWVVVNSVMFMGDGLATKKRTQKLCNSITSCFVFQSQAANDSQANCEGVGGCKTPL